MNVWMTPTDTMVSTTEGGLNTVVRNYFRYLPGLGVTFVDSLDSADIQAVHVSLLNSYRADLPLVAHLHGLHWTADYEAEPWEYEVNRSVIENVRHASVVTVPSDWVALSLRRDLHLDPFVIGHGVDWQSWQHKEENQGYVLWNKNRQTDVCDPEPAMKLAELTSSKMFATTFGRDLPNTVRTGVLPYVLAQQVVQRCGVYLATVKETFGIGILEAMAAGKPVLGFAHGGILDLVEHGVNGYLARPGNMEDLQEGLDYCFKHAKRLGEAGRQKAKAYTWEAVAQQVYGVWQKAMWPEAPSVTVVIPCYNYAHTMERAVESVMAQTLPPKEVIVVDNNSTDNTQHVVGQLNRFYPNVSYLNEPRQGVAHARNAGIAEASSPYILCLDADDAVDPTFLETCVRALQADPSLGVVYTGLRTIDSAGNEQEASWPREYNFDQFLTGQPQVPTASVFRKEAWKRLGGYRQRFAPLGAGSEDAEFFLRMGGLGWGAAKVTDAPLFVYTIGQGYTSKPNYVEEDWRAGKPWINDGLHPLASMATPTKDSHPVRAYDRPKVSVVIPCAPHHKDHLIDCLDSLEAQSFRQWEAIVVCDGFSCPSELHDAYPFVHFIECTHRGAGAARNVGVGAAKGPFLLFVDADDYLAPNALSSLLYAWQGDKGIVYSDYVNVLTMEPDEARRVERDGRLVEYRTRSKQATVRGNALLFDRERAMTQPVVDSSGVRDVYIWCLITSLIPRRWFDEVGGFDEKMESWEDWDLWLRLARHGYPFVHVGEPLVYYRMDTGTRRGEGERQAVSLAVAMHLKYEEEVRMGKCCGASSNAGEVYVASPPVNLNHGPLAQVQASEYQLVELIDGKYGDHQMTGPATRIDYGYRMHGDKFLMHIRDIELYPKEGHARQTIRIVQNQPLDMVIQNIDIDEPPLTLPSLSLDNLPSAGGKTRRVLLDSKVEDVETVITLGVEGLKLIKGVGLKTARVLVEEAKEVLAL